MEKLTDLITARMRQAFADAGFDEAYGRVAVSNRPDLCEYQCSGALAAAKQYKRPPMEIAAAVSEKLECREFSMVQTAAPGFINLKLSGEFLAEYIERMRLSPDFGTEKVGAGKTIVVDYGGANVAKPLHIGHLRSAIIGEAMKRIYAYLGYNAIGDVHLGDWGLQMGLIIAELESRQPELCYFDPEYSGDYPQEPPFTIGELEEIYPTASARKNTDPDFAQRAHTATLELQQGRRGYRAIWDHIMRLSVADLKKNYDNLDVHFEKWLGESDAAPYIPPMVEMLKERGVAVESDGALVIPVSEESDKKEMPPCILLKADGSSNYATTDLATMVQRMEDFRPNKMLYLTDKRQALHFEQVFRAARKAGIVGAETELEHVGFGTMNGRDGKPFKTREGGVMRLEKLIAEITDYVRVKLAEGGNVPEAEMENTASMIALAALKYGDLSNQPTKDYVFDLDKFASFEGNTGPYILYTIVRINSILSKYGEYRLLSIQPPATESAKELMLSLAGFPSVAESAAAASSPCLICSLIYEIAVAANKFYHETKILTEPDENLRDGYIALIALVKDVLEAAIHILGFKAPEKM